MSLNDVVQTGGAILAIVLCVVWVVRRIILRRKARKSGMDKCCGCELSDVCNSKKKCEK